MSSIAFKVGRIVEAQRRVVEKVGHLEALKNDAGRKGYRAAIKATNIEIAELEESLNELCAYHNNLG